MSRHLCFVLMPFGKKPDVSGTLVDFDAVFLALHQRAFGVDLFLVRRQSRD